MKRIPCALTIAGSDSSGGAGIQADLKTFQELQSYGMSVITSLTAQNTLGVQDVHHVPLSHIEAQLDSVFSDMPVHALKTGMIANADMMEVIRKKIEGREIPFVLDPVMVATSGDVLISDEARDYLRDHLLPLSTVITPNLPETEYLTEKKIEDFDDMQEAAKILVHEFGAGSALVKGGHLTHGEATDFLYDGKEMHEISARRIDTPNTHGTGCTYGAAITAYLSHGLPLLEAVKKAKEYVTKAIEHSLDLGSGSGPTCHWGIRL